MNIHKLITLLVILFYAQVSMAQYTFEGKVQSDKKQILEAAQVLLTQSDSVVAMSLTDAEGGFLIRNLKNGEYRLHISLLGYTPLDEKFFINNQNTKSTFTLLPEMTGELDEVKVAGSRANVVKRTATGEIYHLSESARNSGDPFRALKEIPRLISNEALQTIRMDDGNSPSSSSTATAFTRASLPLTRRTSNPLKWSTWSVRAICVTT